MKVDNLKGCINNLTFEITRRCNMTCKHCLRGDSQNIDISEEIIDKTLSQIYKIDYLLFTGGEPSLYPKAIEWVINGLIKYNIKLKYFGVIINGKVYSQEFVDNLNKLYQHCLEKDKCCLRISQDRFHEFIDTKNISLYKENCFFKCKAPKDAMEKVLNEGNARINNIGNSFSGRFFAYKRSKTVLFDKWFILPKNTMLYINAIGDVLLTDSLSYDSQKIENIGNILKKPIAELLINSNKVELIDTITK